ncbi:unnamed protein product [Heligmosomoides polygyrus]|uniref:Helitron_like_N domain-containing protein n=1 Tax=Heligmosomoides polygyrus TaxID=6339 RepID=A0A183GMC4_HELPZ|nr:unnamed protein product [Heligmosomoides polygyrus]
MNRFNYLRKNQKELRLNTVRVLHDYMIGDDTHDSPPGRRIILEASFTGGPRHMIAQYQDTMSIISIFGYRVFNLKLKALCHKLFKRNELREVAAYICVVESQKPGLPQNLNNANQIDQIISAELSDPDSDSELFEIVSKNMIHRPCENLNPTSSYMRDSVCTKSFPKNFRSKTSLSVDGYPKYKRHDDGRYITCRGVRMDNMSVAPYCPYLTRVFEAHIKVEITCTRDLTVLESTSTSLTMTLLNLFATKFKYTSTRDMCVLLKLSTEYLALKCRAEVTKCNGYKFTYRAAKH